MLQDGSLQIQGITGRLYLEGGDKSRSVSQLEALVLQYEPEAVYVDAAYLMSAEGKKRGYVSRWESIAEIIGELKALAIRYNIPIFITVQFNRNQKNRAMKGEPDLGDIAGSDAIPQDASIVLGIQKAPAPFSETRRIMTLMKNREGNLCRFLYSYQFQPVNFSELPWEAMGGEEESADTSWMQ
jgi:replicative DNA helicase